MSSTTVRKAVEDYFKSMNSISEKLVEDLQLSSQAEESELFLKEDQSLIQWRKIIDQCLDKKYERICDENKDLNCFPNLLVETGEKLVIDEDTSNGRPFGSSWKDEHSSPFSWETKSQQNLHLLCDESGDCVDGQPWTPKTPPSVRSYKKLSTPKVTPRPSPKPSPALTRKSIKIPPEPLPQATPKITAVMSTEKIPAATGKSTHHKKQAPPIPSVALTQEAKKEEVKPKPKPVGSPPPVPLPRKEEMTLPVAQEEVQLQQEDVISQSSFQMDGETPSKAIPKTGFDFLDNW